jgi:subtilisin-like proprotein convertase family protein
MKKRILLVLATMVAAVLLASGMALAAKAFSNADRIIINSVGTASPYPSQITVSGLRGTIKDVNLKLSGFSHDFPDDVDMLLVGPSGEKAIVMSDAGFGDAVEGVTFVLDDRALNDLPEIGLLTSGTFRPTDYDGTFDVDEFFAPAPDTSGAGSELSVFNGTNPNGTWSLYIVDDASFGFGQIEGWTLVIKTHRTPP